MWNSFLQVVFLYKDRLVTECQSFLGPNRVGAAMFITVSHVLASLSSSVCLIGCGTFFSKSFFLIWEMFAHCVIVWCKPVLIQGAVQIAVQLCMCGCAPCCLHTPNLVKTVYFLTKLNSYNAVCILTQSHIGHTIHILPHGRKLSLIEQAVHLPIHTYPPYIYCAGLYITSLTICKT